MGLAKAGSTAGAQYQARKGVRDEGYGRRYAVSQLGRNIPSTVAAGFGSEANTASNLANQQAVVAQNALNNQRQDQSLIASLLRPAANAVQNWWSTPGTTTATANNPATGNTWANDLNNGVIPMAAGGVVEEPTKALIGEQGDEAVLNEGALRMLGKKNVEKLNRMGNLIRQGVPRETQRSRPMVSLRGVVNA